jgi:hypothetical protein
VPHWHEGSGAHHCDGHNHPAAETVTPNGRADVTVQARRVERRYYYQTPGNADNCGRDPFWMSAQAIAKRVPPDPFFLAEDTTTVIRNAR